MTSLIPDLIPKHVAIIMDGNGRWASQRGLPRFEGHRRGVEALRRTIRAAEELGIRYLTVYSFSSENWKRPAAEVSDLMGLLRRFIRNDLAELHARNIRIRVIGVKEGLALDIVALLDESEHLTQSNTGLTFVVAFNYGARREITDAARLIAEAVKAGQLDPQAIDEKLFASYLNTDGIPDPELVIRTSGEQRLSNFLLWQASYSEFVFTAGHWPDFGRESLVEALLHYQSRDRRFGGLSSAIGGVR
ncbi:MAG: isoprenyl transferase [Hyphomicrobiales bacterium]|nr:isoprenyl transferase [Hyphomicrobiales bacterium]